MTANTIGPSHPSFGCERVAFLFGEICPGPFGGITNLILVEANNEWAVQVLERVLVLANGKVNSRHQIISVFRDVGSIGLRSNDITEIDFVKFMTTVIDPGWIVNDPITAEAFTRSLSEEEKDAALELIDQMAEVVSKPTSAPKSRPTPVVIPKPQVTLIHLDNYDKAMSALVDLGYKKPHVKRVLDGMGVIVNSMTISEVVKIALQKAAS